MRDRIVRLAACAAIAFWLAAPLGAQSITSGSITGAVRSTDGIPVARALVVVSPIGSGSSYEVTTSSSGTFSLGLVQPGSYEVRAEAFGYRPVVARVLTVGGGERRSIELTLAAAPPPVLTVDTVALAAGSSTRWRPGGVRFGVRELGLPHRFDDLASVASLSSAFDRSLGAQGLPGDMTLVVADGVPFRRAPHPTARAELLPDALFPRSALSAVMPIHAAPDAESSGSAAGYIGIATRSSTADGGVELEGGYSGDPLWSSGELTFDAPSLLTVQGALRGTVLITPGVSQLTLSGEGHRQQTPLSPRMSQDVDFIGLDPALLAGVSGPDVETYARYSGLARLDIQRSATSRIFVRGAGALSTREFEDWGPVSLQREAAPAEESFDYSFAGGLVTQYSPAVQLELRGGFSGSAREFGSGSDALPGAYLATSAARLGAVSGTPAESSRTDFTLLPMLRYTAGVGSTIEAGATVRVSSHSMTAWESPVADLFFTDPGALASGEGFGGLASAPEESFGTQEYGLFAQYETALTPELRMTLGARYDFERLAGDRPEPNADWLTASGLANVDHPTAFHQVGGGGSLTWEPGGTGDTQISLVTALREGDLDTRAVYELLARDVGATSTAYAGTGLDWTAGTLPAGATERPSLTLLGHDTRAPRSMTLSAGIVRRVGRDVELFVRGSMRRTDFLMRRRDLNIPAVAHATDPGGRGILGTLEQTGALITATGEDARRFAAFGDVWALDPDGWSEYRGLTAGVEHSSAAVDLYGSYTFSETTDNWVGAASGSIGAMLRPGLPDTDDADWSEGISDFDVPHRVAAGATARLGPVSVSTLYRFRSGRPFTPRYRLGVDANGDGSIENDVAFVPGDAQLVTLMDEWPCLNDQAGSFAARNSCRGPERHSLDARLEITLGRLAGRTARVTLDVFDLVEDAGGMIDDALLLVDPTGSITTSADGSTVTIPLELNPSFGEVLYPTSRGRMLRLGVRIGG